jgi:hypothetical protein
MLAALFTQDPGPPPFGPAPGRPTRVAATTCLTDGLTMAFAPTTTVGTVSSPPVI